MESFWSHPWTLNNGFITLTVTTWCSWIRKLKSNVALPNFVVNTTCYEYMSLP